MATAEPVITWNLFVNLIGLPTLGWWIISTIKAKDKLQSENMLLWQEGAKERSANLEGKLIRVENCLASIKEDLNGKRDNHECERIHEAMDKKVDKLESKLWT